MMDEQDSSDVSQSEECNRSDSQGSQSDTSTRVIIRSLSEDTESIQDIPELTPDILDYLTVQEEQVKNIRSTSQCYRLTENQKNFDEYFNACDVEIREYSNDVQNIIDYYVRYGVCDPRSPHIGNDDATKMRYLSKKYALNIDGVPEDYTVSISQVAAFVPYIMAVRLEQSHPLLIGSLNGLPQSLAFPGGLHLIPKNSVTWKPLEILWKMWKVSYPENVVCTGGRDDFMAIRYFLLSSEDTLYVINDFCINPPSASEVCNKIDGILSSYNYDTLYSSFEKVFSIYAEDVFKFYRKNSTMFLAENLVNDINGHPNAIDVYKKLYSMTSAMPDDVTVDPIYKGSDGESPPLVTRTFEDVMTESGKDEYLQEKVQVLETKIQKLKAIILNRIRKARDRNPHDKNILVKEHELLASLKRLADARDEYSKKLQQQYETDPHEALVPCCQSNLPIKKRNRCTSQNSGEKTRICQLSNGKGSSKRNRSFGMEREVPEFSKYCDHRTIYKSREDFRKLPSVLEIESQQECSLRESGKKCRYSQRNSKRTLKWCTIEQKLYWDYDFQRESLLSVEGEMPCETQIILTHFSSTSLEDRLKEEVRQYFARNPIKVCVSMSLQSRKLPITEEFLRTLVGQIKRSISDGNGAERGEKVTNTSNVTLSNVLPQTAARLISGENGQSNWHIKKDKVTDSRQSPVSVFNSNHNTHKPEGIMPVRPQLMEEDIRTQLRPRSINVSGSSASRQYDQETSKRKCEDSLSPNGEFAVFPNDKTPRNIDPVEDEGMTNYSSFNPECDEESAEMVCSPVLINPGITKQVCDENLPTCEPITYMRGTGNIDDLSEWLLTKGATAGMEHLQGPVNLNPALLQSVGNIGEYIIPEATDKMLLEEAVKQSIINAKKKPTQSNNNTEDRCSKIRVTKPFGQIFDSTEFSIAPLSNSLEFTLNLSSNDRLLLGVIYHNFLSGPPSPPGGGTTKRTAQIRKVIRARMADPENFP